MEVSENLRSRPDATRPRSYADDMMRVGKQAEEEIIAWLKANPYIVKHEDLRGLRQLQTSDVDLLLYTLGGRTPLIEIKSDYYLGFSGNVIFEVLRIQHTSHPENTCVLGWTARTPATYLMYYSPRQRRVYICRPDELRGAFQRYTFDARTNNGINLKVVNTDQIKTTVNVLIPWKYCEPYFSIYKL